MQLSVLIPTYNRCDKLAQALQALFQQQELADVAWEILVVDDGSTDGTGEWTQSLATRSPVPLNYFYQENRGPAAARNRGLLAAAAPLVLMMGDDILAAPDLLARHLAAHERHAPPQDAVLGRVDWSPTLTITPFMRWWGENRFRFDALQKGKAKLDFSFFYTCNISVKRDFLLENGLFDEAFRAAAYEDTELAYRLHQAGLKIHFVPRASAYHDHPTDLKAACRQMEVIGRWSLLFEAKTHFWSAPPTWIRVGKLPGLLHPLLIRPLRAWAHWLQDRATVGPLYTAVMIHHFWVGRRTAYNLA